MCQWAWREAVQRLEALPLLHACSQGSRQIWVNTRLLCKDAPLKQVHACEASCAARQRPCLLCVARRSACWMLQHSQTPHSTSTPLTRVQRLRRQAQQLENRG